MPRRDGPHLVEGANLVPFVRRIRDAVAKVEDSHDVFKLVGAAGFEPTTSLELNQGALTAELHAYFFTASNRWHPANQPWPDDLGAGKWHPFPQCYRHLKLLVDRAQMGDFPSANQMIPVR